ncbi:MAG TPA: SIS domain-containing protein [Gemmatimonadales bacterium]|nr:SIS domain-containing protein [Gemmatimonadales bacterium]
MSRSRVEEGLDQLAHLATASKSLSAQVADLAARYAAVLRDGGTLYFCGNGGSAADAQHLATEYIVRFRVARRPFAAVALTTDASLLTAAGNDLGFEQIFARQVDALCGPGDLLVLHSTSGRSPNLMAAARAARARGAGTAAFLGRDGGPLAAEVDQAVVVRSDETSQIQVMHMALEHLIVELVEDELLRGS